MLQACQDAKIHANVMTAGEYIGTNGVIILDNYEDCKKPFK